MIVWQVKWQHPDHGRLLAWAESEKRAKQILVEAISDYQNPDDAKPNGISKIEIPTDKAGLIGWLNVNFTSDNG